MSQALSTTGATPALKSKTLASAIADRLRQEIVAGVHAAGAQLRQDALAAAYGVSRIPVREALLALEAEGLVRIAPHKGAVVTPLSTEEVRDVFDLRILLEPRLLAQSAPRLEAADFVDLDATRALFADAVARRDRARWGELNARLHMSMYRRAPSPRTLSIVAGLLQTSERYTRLQLASDAALRRAEREHDDLVARCRAGDVDGACAALVAHIETVRADLLTLAAR